MFKTPDDNLDKLRTALAGLEAQRGLLGEAVEPALELVRRQIAALEAQAAQAEPAPAPQPETPPAQPSQVEEERRIVSILFTDIVGSTALAERLDPEDWRQIVAEIHAIAGEQVTANHGRVVQYLGDGLLALFGTQNASETDPEHAVQAALAIQASLEALSLDPPIQLRAGVHTGLVVIGELGSEARREYTASGDAMNLAARLQSAAPPGGVLISQDVYHQVHGSFETEPQPPLLIKGKREPVQTYLVIHARERRFESLRRGVQGIETRTVGREAETRQIQAAYLTAYEKRSVSWAQLIGEAGVGKSRLLDDLQEWLDLRPERLRLLRGRAYPGDVSQPYALVRRIWFDRFQITEDEPLASAEEKWVRAFQQLAQTDQVEPAQALGLLVGLLFHDSPHLAGMRDNPGQIRGRAVVIGREVLGAIRLQQPLAFLLEDLHWADAPSLEYLIDVIFEKRPEQHQLLQGEFVLATSRQEWTPPPALKQNSQAEPAAYFEIQLEPLTPQASQELALELLQRVDGLSDDVVRLIVERAEGVPYYTEELVNLLIDRGVIDASAERWRFLPDRLDPAQLPLTLQHLLLTRLLSLPPSERLCLQRGSIFGRNFWEGGLEALGTQTPGRLLDPLQPRGFVNRQPVSAFGQNIEWSFHHNLLRDVSYESLLKRERPGLHKSAAAWLEAQARQADRLNEFAGVLAEHAERAGERVAAADWYQLAGEQAKALGATREAKSDFDRALDLIPPDDRERRWRALLARNDALTMLGDLTPRQSNQALLLELAYELDDTRLAEALYRKGNLLENQGDYPAAFEAYDQAVAAARRAGDQRLEALVLGIKVIGQNRVGDVAGATYSAETAMAIVPQLEEKFANRVINNVAVYYIESGDVARAARLHQTLADSNQRLGDRDSATNSLSNLGYSYSMLGLYPQARTALELALQYGRAIEARRESNYILLNLGLVHWRCGETDAARKAIEQANSDLTALSDAMGRAWGASYLGLVNEQAGAWGAAQACFAQARVQFQQMGVHGCAMDALAGIARCALADGDSASARDGAVQVWSYLQDPGSRALEFPILAYLTCAQVFEAADERDLCRKALEEGYQELQERAAKISDEEWRQSFLNNVAEHRKIQSFRQRLFDELERR
jgi:class 3 adenylate cyclase/tetratricopeptide (TPR) repeat protein